MDKILNRIKFLDLENKVDNIIWENLYSIDGYLNLESKQAVEKYNDYIERFNSEVAKNFQDVDVKNLDYILKNKKEEYISILKNHLKEEIYVWMDEIYNQTIENICFKVSLYKNNKNILDELYSKAISLISWLCEIKKYDLKTKKELFNDVNKKYFKALNSDINEYIPKNNSIITDVEIYFKLLDLFRCDKENYLKSDIDSVYESLNKSDYNYFKYLKQIINTYLYQQYCDEIDLIYSAFEILNLKNKQDKYNFLQEIKNDFLNFKTTNKSILEKDKIEIIKRRIEIFRDFKGLKPNLKYFKKLLLI